MTNHTITIAVDSSGNFTYTPAALHVATGDGICWQCASNFVIMFKEGSPIGNMMAQGQGQSVSSTYTYAFVTSMGSVNSAASGHYHYSVAVWDGTYVWIDAGCPVIIADSRAVPDLPFRY